MGAVRELPAYAGGARLGDAAAMFLDTVSVPNTRRGYGTAVDRLVADFGADTSVATLDPDRVAGWFTFVWAGRSPKTFNTRLTALGSACSYWRDQGWLVGDPLVRLRTRPVPRDRARALTQVQVQAILAEGTLRDRVLWTLLYETAARSEEVLALNVPDLDTANRRAVVVRKGGARDVIVWQTATARLLPRLLAGRRRGPVFLTDRAARPSGAGRRRSHDWQGAAVLSTGGRAVRSPHRRHVRWAIHPAPAAPFRADPRRRNWRLHPDADGSVRAHLGAIPGHLRPRFR